jgi:hypothetical protein
MLLQMIRHIQLRHTITVSAFLQHSTAPHLNHLCLSHSHPHCPAQAAGATSSSSTAGSGSGFPSGRRTPEAPPPLVDSSPGHMREYLTQVLTTWVDACCAPPPPEDEVAARAAAAAECSADSSCSLLACASWQQVAGHRAGAGGLPQVVSPGEALLRLEGYLALERGAPPVPDAAHIHHKALYDAANEALLAAYERRGRLAGSVSAAGGAGSIGQMVACRLTFGCQIIQHGVLLHTLLCFCVPGTSRMSAWRCPRAGVLRQMTCCRGCQCC